MIRWVCLFIFCAQLFATANGFAEVTISEATEECLDCHAVFHPGIVEDWRRGRHAAVSPGAAMAVEGMARKVSAKKIPESLKGSAVGCAECHTLRADQHKDSFEHNGYQIHVVVSPDDCRTCHTQEADQYRRNPMSFAYGNLMNNAIYQQLQASVNRIPVAGSVPFESQPADADTNAETCLHCHGTRLEKIGEQVRDTDAGELTFPVIQGWPNQGVGRLNLDGSRGACTSCHTRHHFSIQEARKPSACQQCHVGPDVPAYKIYMASKHGSIYQAHQGSWDFKAVPWTLGQDFAAPTCAVCHLSLVVNPDGDVISERTHQMTDRLSYRIFGPIYSHPQPIQPDTTIITNSAGLPLPTDLDGTPASAFLIDKREQQVRDARMQATCLSCHDSSWVSEYWRRMKHTLKKTNQAVRVATQIMQKGWQQGFADPAGNLFDESMEKRWTEAWLFHANHIRYASAMAGGGDYGVYANGRYYLNRSIVDLQHWLTHAQAKNRPETKVDAPSSEDVAQTESDGESENDN